MIINEIEHLPHGYAFWHSLPSKGRKSPAVLVKKWTAQTLRLLFPPQLRQAAVLASLNSEGVPDDRSRALYAWLLRVIYKGNAQHLYRDWCNLKQAVENQPSLLFKPKVVKKPVRPAAMPRQGMFTWHAYPPARQPLALPHKEIEHDSNC